MHYTKRILSALLMLLLTVSLALPALAMGPAVTERTDYITEESATLGWPGHPLTVRGDGSFTVVKEDSSAEVIFGERVSDAQILFEDEPYPISTHKFVSKGIAHTVEQFVYKSEAGSVYVFSRLSAKNTTDVSVSFPKAVGAEAISTSPAEIAPGKSASQDYVTKVIYTDGEKTESYDSAKTLTCAYWDEYLSDKLTANGLSKAESDTVNAYRRQLINNALGLESEAAALALASPSLAHGVLSEGGDAYAAALALLKTNDTEAALGALPAIKAELDGITVSETDLPFETLEDNLDALLSLQGYAYILSALSDTDDAFTLQAQNVKDSCSVLADCIANAIKDTESKLSCDWECANTDSSSKILLCSEDFSSAVALYEWYIKSSAFSFAPSKELIALSTDAKTYFSANKSPSALLQSLITEKEDGTIIIGRGAPLSTLRDGASFTVDNYTLSTGSVISLSVAVKKKTVSISLNGEINAPITVQFSSFADNIEYASTGFDNDSGTVTAPEGTTSITVRLVQGAKQLEKDRSATAKLESAIARAYEKSFENCTTVSYDEFIKNLKYAEKARTSTTDEKLEAAEALTKATEQLSPLTAGYVYTLPESGIQVGNLKSGEIYQKFSLPSTGHVDTLFIKGEYCDGVSAAVYTLRGDAYTTDELCAESYGEEAPGGIAFKLDFDFEADKTYVLCIFCEIDDVTLYLDKSYEHTVYTQELGETTLYTGASLFLEFSVSQVNRSGLDTFYSACLEADVSGYTKESQKTLKAKMKEAKTVLCTPSVTKEEYDKAYDELKEAYDGLSTYASDDKVEKAPVVGLVLIGIVIVLLAGTFISALLARKRMNS